MNESEISRIVIAKWTDRFLAWLIDFVIVSAVCSLVIWAAFGALEYELGDDVLWVHGTNYIPTSIVFFAYWTILEFKTGRTIGKKILNLRVTDVRGDRPDMKGVMIGSFGKSFLLPVDVILGWIFTNKKRQRIFSNIGDTLVVKVRDSEDDSGLTYVKD